MLARRPLGREEVRRQEAIHELVLSEESYIGDVYVLHKVAPSPPRRSLLQFLSSPLASLPFFTSDLSTAVL
jgi:hypothetical protein